MRRLGWSKVSSLLLSGLLPSRTLFPEGLFNEEHKMSAQPAYPASIQRAYVGRPMPRGIRNNNPGNIRLGDAWQGLCSIQQDKSFCQFDDIEHGVRALALVLTKYQKPVAQKGYALNTVYKIIMRWAPPEENDTVAYIAAVAAQMGVSSTDVIDLSNDTNMLNMVKAIIRHENGIQPYADAELIAGIRLAR